MSSGWNSQQLGLCLVRIGHEAAFDDIGRAGYRGQRSCDRPPVQNSAVAIRQWRARQASRTDCAKARVSAPNTENSANHRCDQKHAESVNRRQQIVEHDAETRHGRGGPPSSTGQGFQMSKIRKRTKPAA